MSSSALESWRWRRKETAGSFATLKRQWRGRGSGGGVRSWSVASSLVDHSSASSTG